MAKDHIEIINLKKKLASTIPTIPVNFTDLADTFAYAGNALKTVRVNATATGLEAYTISIDQTRIQDGTNTTYLDVDEVANVIKGKSANTGTNDIFQLYEGSGTPVKAFHVDGYGNIWNNGNKVLYKSTADRTIQIGTFNNNTFIAADNTIIGVNASNGNRTGGTGNVIIGARAAYSTTGGSDNILIGNLSGYGLTSPARHIGIGSYSFYSSTSNYCVGIGYKAGYYPNGNYHFYLDNIGQSNAANQLTNGLAVGLFDASPANQWMRLNAKLCVNVAPLTNMVAGDAVLQGGSLILKEITTPTADADYGKIYTKSDNKLYFQDGGGTEHEITYV